MRKAHLRVDELHSRALPSATLVNGVLTVTGTDGNDVIVVRQAHAMISVKGMSIDVNGVMEKAVKVADVTSVDVNALGGNDRVNLSSLRIGATVDGGAGNDRIFGGRGNDSLIGDSGDDSLNGGAGDDSLDGGAGNDVENGGQGNDDLMGGDGNDTESGGAGNDDINGDAGDDSLNGRAGDDSLQGGAGDDSESGGAGNDDVNGDAGDDSLSGGSGRDFLQGGTGDDSASGDMGDDSVHGGLGDDSLSGGSGTDEVSGDTGDDHCHGGESQGTGADFRAALTDVNGQPVGTAEVQAEDNGQTEFQVEVHGAAANTTFDVTIDVAGDGTNVVAAGQLVTNAEGEGQLEVHDLANLPPLQDGVSVLHLRANPTDPGKDLAGTFAAHKNGDGTQLEASLSDPSDPTGPQAGRAEFDPTAGQFEVKVSGLDPNTTYNVFLNGDATTGTQVAHVTTDSQGRGKVEIVTDAGFPALQTGSVATVADANGVTVLSGQFGNGGDDN